ncbi:ankyrin, partial [Thozetella sp. PMI_491]
RTALQKAAEVGAYKILEYLINLGADINAPAAGTGGATALQFAAVHGFVGIADRLLREGADPNAPAALLDGRTALEGAAEHGRLDMVQLLRNFGARIDGPYRSQYEQALRRASDNGHFAVVDLLKSY